MAETLTKKTIQLARAPKSLRLTLLRDDVSSDDARIAAVIEIQRIVRGFIVRNLGLELYVAWRANQMERTSSITPPPTSVRHDVSRRTERNISPVVFKSEQPPITRKPTVSLTLSEAATKIQRFWRRHIDIQVYKYYRDLINFKSQGDPSMMLKCINPKESALLDAASGTHIKFRLAGERFPPNIYYKIFTHRPIQDLCTYAPRDYTRNNKLKDMRTLHNKQFEILDSDSMDNWYKRIENNGWRLVSDRMIPHMLSDPVTWSTHTKKIDSFKHNKVLRKQDVEKARKKKKIDWMKKMYLHGMLKAKTADDETKALVEGATTGMLTTIDMEGLDAVDEWEVDELLDWTTTLNYEDYMSSWKQVGTSSVSEMAVEKRLLISRDEDDAFGLNLNTESKLSSKGSQKSLIEA